MTPDEQAFYEAADKNDGLSRREFLEILSASFAALALTGCNVRPPKEKIVPLAESPENYAPGLARWYATTCGGCPSACGVLAKSRDGRPIKLEGNPDHPLSRGGLCARGQASLLDLYDTQRLRGPLLAGQPAGWDRLDAEVSDKLKHLDKTGGRLLVLTPTLVSPSARESLSLFLKAHPKAEHAVYDAVSHSAILEAHRLTHGRRVLPHYRFAAARVIVSFDADFLGTWISPVEFTRDWAANRRPDAGWDLMSWHAQFEPRMSLSGANADLHVPVLPSQQLATVLGLGRRIARAVHWKGPLPQPDPASEAAAGLLGATAEMLAGARRHSLVVSGSRDVNVQLAVNWINEMLGNYGETLDLSRPALSAEGDDAAVEKALDGLLSGAFAGAVLWGVNPVYDHPKGEAIAAALAKLPFSVALAERKDETAAACRLVAAAPHALEAWGDAEPVAGAVSLFQPLVSPLFDSRPALESLLRWSGKKESAYDFVRAHWRSRMHPRHKGAMSFDAFWQESVRNGVAPVEPEALRPGAYDGKGLAALRSERAPAPAGRFELALYPSVALFDGRQANNPWLQELPDPVSKVTWGNVAAFSPEDAAALGLEDGRVVRLSDGSRAVELPAHVQPGLAKGAVAVAVGYGRREAGPIAANYPMVKMLPLERDLLGGADMNPFARSASVAVERTARVSELAKTQRYDTGTDPILGFDRAPVRQTTLPEYFKDPAAGNPPEAAESTLWPRHEYKGHKWAMAIDLNACTGCSACVVACQAENNVPVVGKAEVRKSREMAWLRIDRYYSAINSATPEVAFQPMLCQHCDNAPCETVCPVLATVHSSEGLNMQVYNRCVGTRYCANNCPFKVRRFNWFDYGHQDLLQNLALNPDVTVRSRGVMEKCSFCVQRVYTAQADAKVAGRPLKDGDVKSACQQSCPAQAIVFGDLNDPDSRVAALSKDPRRYRVLAELGVGPSVFYLTKVRNPKV